MTNNKRPDLVAAALNRFQIEIPSWGFANTGTRFGKFVQACRRDHAGGEIQRRGRGASLDRRLSRPLRCTFSGISPRARPACSEVQRLAAVMASSPVPSIPTSSRTRFTSTAPSAIPTRRSRQEALNHVLDSVEIQTRLGSRDLSLWFADGSNYPGTQKSAQRKKWFEEGLAATHAKLSGNQRMLVEYKPFEPAFYHTDIADWGMALLLAQSAGPQRQGAGRHRSSLPGAEH